jgi:hypothetical protein
VTNQRRRGKSTAAEAWALMQGSNTLCTFWIIVDVQ